MAEGRKTECMIKSCDSGSGLLRRAMSFLEKLVMGVMFGWGVRIRNTLLITLAAISFLPSFTFSASTWKLAFSDVWRSR